MKLFHTSDVHLGHVRLDGRLPDSDFADAFENIVDTAIAEQADVFLIAGDLFDKPQVEPAHLRQAQRILSKLKQAGIPAVAIEGNHDKAFVHSDAATWLTYLSQDGLLHLLRTPFDTSGPLLTPWDVTTKSGAFLDIGGVRFVGAGYLGAATPHKLRQIVDGLDASRTNVVLLHAGPDYFVGEGGGFSPSELKSFHDKITYLALGHMHKPIRYESWACNPGSPENVNLNHAAYDRDKKGNPLGRGYAVVLLDPADRSGPQSIDVRSNRRRPVSIVELDCTPFDRVRKGGPESLIEAAVKAIRAMQPSGNSVVDLRLTGDLNLNKIALDIPKTCAAIEAATGVFAISIDTGGLNAAINGTTPEPGGEGGLSRADLERNAIRALVAKDSLWRLDAKQDAFAELFYALKEGVQQSRPAESMAEQILLSPLTPEVQAANETPQTEDTTEPV